MPATPTTPTGSAHRNQCPLCNSRRLSYGFSHQTYRIERCSECELMFLNPPPSDEELGKIYNAEYFLGNESEEGRKTTSELKQATAQHYLAELTRYQGAPSGRLLEVGCGTGDFLAEAEAAGYEVLGVEYAEAACATANERLKHGRVEQGELKAAKLPDSHFDVCVLNDVIEHVRDPIAFLREIQRVLRPGGALFIATPSLDSWSARFMKERWMEWKPEHLLYFNAQNIQTALLKTGFGQVLVRPGTKVLNFDYVKAHFDRFPVPIVTRGLRTLGAFLPKSVRSAPRNVVASGMMVFCRKAAEAKRQKLSVIIPAFNEAATVKTLVDSVLKKQILGIDIEIILVESNSTDGTREIAAKLAHHPRVNLILEDRPRGKGHAVRAGLAAATGEYILIQDADLEYDLEDYEAVLDPILSGRAAFVLGSRHGGRNIWKMRQFTGQRFLSLFLNFGHWLFTTLVNVLFFQRLRDPFTMYKVFRRDCLYGLTFQCDRFDFDYELLIKLLRKGYQPVEIPVNYRSRSFKEGKKVSIWRDPITWLRALVRLRFAKVDPLAEIERQRNAEVTLTLPAPAATAIQPALLHR